MSESRQRNRKISRVGYRRAIRKLVPIGEPEIESPALSIDSDSSLARWTIQAVKRLAFATGKLVDLTDSDSRLVEVLVDS